MDTNVETLIGDKLAQALLHGQPVAYADAAPLRHSVHIEVCGTLRRSVHKVVPRSQLTSRQIQVPTAIQILAGIEA